MTPNETIYQTYFQNLTPKQKKAIPLLAAGESGKEVASAIKCNPATVSQWLNHDSGFNQALHIYSQVSIYKAQLQLDSLAVTAITELRDLMLNARSEQVRLKAIELVINSIGLGSNGGDKVSVITPQKAIHRIDVKNYDLNKLVEALGDSNDSC